jgi:hypothetical protein
MGRVPNLKLCSPIFSIEVPDVLIGYPMERDHRVCRRALAELSPIVHEVPALLKEVAAPISGLDRVAFFEIGRRAVGALALVGSPGCKNC